jgi:hypothetical protein
LRFTVHRPLCGEVSLCWYRPPGGDVACCVHVGIARPCFAGDAREDRLVLAVFGRDVPAGGASLRRVRGRDPLEPSRSLVVEPGYQLPPPLPTDRAIEAPLLRDPNARMFNRAARGAGHRPHVEFLDSNGVEPARQIGRGLFHPVASPVRFVRFDSGDRHLGALSTVGATLGSCKVLLQPAQPDLLTGCKARGVQQRPGGQCRRHRHTAIDAYHTAIGWPGDRVGNVRESDMPATGPIPSDAVGLDLPRYGPCPTEADPPNLRYPNPPVTPGELLDMAWLEANLSEAFVHAGLAPGGTAMGAGEEVTHGLREVAQRLLLHRLRSGRQPVVFGTYLSQLRRLFVVSRRAASGLPHLLLFHGQVPHEPGMPAMLQHRHLLSRCRQQPEPRHTGKVATATDSSGQRQPAHVGIGVPRRGNCRGFSPKDFR